MIDPQQPMRLPSRVVITGAAGLVGQNLVRRLTARGGVEIVAIDKHPANTSSLRQHVPDIQVIKADLAEPGAWANAFEGAEILILNHAQISATGREPFTRNNVTATRHVLDVASAAGVEFVIHISTSAVRSKADDFYVSSKREQEELVRAHTLPHCVLRPTLMFGWFDRKHLGWLKWFLERSPVFPVPGNGRYVRQPLYVGDFCEVVMACMRDRPAGEVFDISGHDKVDYIEIIRTIRRVIGCRTPIVKVPYSVFWTLLFIASKVLRNPPFTTQQLEALVIPETFPIMDWPSRFGVRRTSFEDAVRQTFLHPENSRIQLEF